MASTSSKSPIRAIMAASSGNLVEWYDFYTYSFLAIYFSSAFFPSGDSTSQLLKTAGIFAVGFLMRPIGGWLFGRMADKQGRRAAMVASVLLMSLGSLIICLLPTYASIGVWAPLLLLLARMLQGLSVGGEYGASATYMSEVATAGRRGFYSSFQYVTLIGGQLLSLLVLVLMQQWLSEEDLKAWGWRIPFAIGALAAVVALYLRKSLDETATGEGLQAAEVGTLKSLWKYRQSCHDRSSVFLHAHAAILWCPLRSGRSTQLRHCLRGLGSADHGAPHEGYWSNQQPLSGLRPGFVGLDRG
jgi:MHS family alpha-ketoglutarate permease-like MFS transporter